MKDSSQRKTISLVRGTAVVSSLTLLSRMLGFLRDLIIARGFGSGTYADCFFVAFRIPNLLRSFVAEGAFSSAFVPIFADAARKGSEESIATIRRVSGFLLCVTSILAALGILFAPQIIEIFAPGFREDPALMALCIELTRYMLPLILCVSLVAMLNGALNTLGTFGVAAWSQVWMNVVLIAGALISLWCDQENGIRVLALSALLGSIIQVLVQLPALRRNGLTLNPQFALFHQQIKQLSRLMLPALIGATVYQLGIFLNTMLASLLAPGSISWLYYADRLVQFPLGTFSLALGSVLLPALSVAHAKGDQSQFDQQTFAALRYTSFFILPLTGLVFALAEPLTKLLFERGSFMPHDTAMTAAAVQMYALGIWFVSSHSLLARSFIARKDTLSSTLVGLGSLAVNFIVSLLVIGAIQAQGGVSSLVANFQGSLTEILPSTDMGHRGLGLASTCGSLFSVITLAFLSRRFLSKGWPDYFRTTIESLLATIALVAAILFTPIPQEISFLLGAGLQVCAGILAWGLVVLLLRSREGKEIIALVRRRFSEKTAD